MMVTFNGALLENYTVRFLWTGRSSRTSRAPAGGKNVHGMLRGVLREVAQRVGENFLKGFFLASPIWTHYTTAELR